MVEFFDRLINGIIEGKAGNNQKKYNRRFVISATILLVSLIVTGVIANLNYQKSKNERQAAELLVLLNKEEKQRIESDRQAESKRVQQFSNDYDKLFNAVLTGVSAKYGIDAESAPRIRVSPNSSGFSLTGVLDLKIDQIYDANGVEQHNFELKDYRPGGFKLTSEYELVLLETMKKSLGKIMYDHSSVGRDVRINITGFADAIPVSESAIYEGPDYIERPYYSKNNDTYTQFNLLNGDKLTNEDFACLRAFIVADEFKSIPGVSDHNIFVSTLTTDTDIGGDYRKVVIKIDIEGLFENTDSTPLAIAP